MSPDPHGADPGASRFPRVSGDEPEDRLVVRPILEFSPRERG